MAYIVFAGVNGMWSIAAFFLAVQVLVNVYPILHLRHVRGRLDSVHPQNGRGASKRSECDRPGRHLVKMNRLVPVLNPCR